MHIVGVRTQKELDKAIANDNENTIISLYGAGSFKVKGNVAVWAFNVVKVEVYDTVTIYAHDIVTVDAYDNAKVTAYHCVKATMHDNAIVEYRSRTAIIIYSGIN